MQKDAYETYTIANTDKRRIYHRRTCQVIATVHMNSAEGIAFFNAVRKLIREAEGTLFDLDTGEYLK